MVKIVKVQKRIAQLGMIIGLMLYQQITHAQPNYQREEDWRLHPITLQINTNPIGYTLPLNLIEPSDNKYKSKLLRFWGVGGDLSILYVKRSLWQLMDAYFRLGLQFDYRQTPNQGSIISGLIYLEPNYQHATDWELLPRLGFGVAYPDIPGHHPLTDKDKEDEIPVPQVDALIAEPCFDFNLAFAIRYRLTPKWHIYSGLGVDYLLAFQKEVDENGNDDDATRKTLTLFHFMLGGSYTFNPSPQNYIRTEPLKKSRIDIAILNSFKRAAVPPVETPQPPPINFSDDDDEDEDDEDTIYYIRGLYTQGNLHLANNHYLILGTEWLYNGAMKKLAEIAGLSKTTAIQAGLIVGHEFKWGKLSFAQSGGFHFLNGMHVQPPLGLLYTRLTLNYYITDYLFIGTSAKTTILPEKGRYFGLDHIDFRIGYAF